MLNEPFSPKSIAPDTIRGFLGTDYSLPEVSCVLRVGTEEPIWEAWCLDHSWSYYGVLTADNPMGKLLGESDNSNARKLLELELRARGFDPLISVHQDRLSAWPDETGWVFPARLEEMIELAGRFCQLGFVWALAGEKPELYIRADVLSDVRFLEFGSLPYVHSF